MLSLHYRYQYVSIILYLNQSRWSHWGTVAWILTHLLGYIAMLGLYILSRESLERMYSPSIAMYPSKCVCIHASVPQCIEWFAMSTQQAQKHLYNICTKSSQRLRRWSSFVQMLHKWCVFAG